MSQLREVLHQFDGRQTPVSIKQMSREMNIEIGVLHDMINYWVRKGKLREVNSSGEQCNTCGIKGACPFIVALPRYYERINDSTPPEPPCCQGSCKV